MCASLILFKSQGYSSEVNGLKQETTTRRYLRSAAIEMILTSQCSSDLYCKIYPVKERA